MLEKIIDVLNNFIKDVIDMNEEYFNIHEWQKEKMEELVRYNYYKDGIDEGKLEGMANIIKEMLKDNVDVKLISKYTNKSIEEIKKIEESMKLD